MAFILFDEHLGQVHPAGEVRFLRPSATIRDLIRARIELELEKQHDQAALARPGPAEVALNGKRGAYGLSSMFLDPATGRNDVEALVKAAEQGFERGHYFILVDDRQAEGIDEVIDLEKTGEATFLLLTPLQGG